MHWYFLFNRPDILWCAKSLEYYQAYIHILLMFIYILHKIIIMCSLESHISCAFVLLYYYVAYCCHKDFCLACRRLLTCSTLMVWQERIISIKISSSITNPNRYAGIYLWDELPRMNKPYTFGCQGSTSIGLTTPSSNSLKISYAYQLMFALNIIKVPLSDTRFANFRLFNVKSLQID